jgi:hypothetical protein
MITLLIDSKKVNLSVDTSIEFLNRNVFFTKEGQHTLDIDIDLSDAVNALVYKNMHRIDVIERPQNRTALMYSERGIIIKGTEIVLSIDDKKAKIQIVAGNSEINYLIGNERTLSELNLGEISQLTNTEALNSVKSGYPDFDYVCCPICVDINTLYDKYLTLLDPGYWNNIYNKMNVKKTKDTLSYWDKVTLCPQPYLVSIVNKVVKALGYTIKIDALENSEKWKRLIIINGYVTLKYNEMVPNWTVKKFITEVENLCYVLFVVDQTNKSIDILNRNDYYKTAPKEYIDKDEIIGDIIKEYDQDPAKGITYNNISFNFPAYDQYKYAAIDDEVMKEIENVNCQSPGAGDERDAYLYDVWETINGSALDDSKSVPDTVEKAYNKMLLYTETNPLKENCEFPFVLRDANTMFNCHLDICNQYAKRKDDTSDNEMSLSIVPCEIAYLRISDGGDHYQYIVPIARFTDYESTEVEETSETQGLNDYIKSGMPDNKKKADQIFVAFYFGLEGLNWGGDYVIPTAAPSYLQLMQIWDNGANPYWKKQILMKLSDKSLDLSINSSTGLYDTVYKDSININLNTVYTINFKSNKSIDSRHIFIIANKKFYCQQLKYKIKKNSVSDIVEGKFYLVE